MLFLAGTIPFQGMTLRDILEKVDLINIQVEEGKEVREKDIYIESESEIATDILEKVYHNGDKESDS